LRFNLNASRSREIISLQLIFDNKILSQNDLPEHAFHLSKIEPPLIQTIWWLALVILHRNAHLWNIDNHWKPANERLKTVSAL
jgi:hypothetical protein